MGKFESQKTDYLDIDKLYEQYKPLMNSIFKKFTKYTNVFHDSSDYEDLKSQIEFEFVKLCNEYTPTRGVDFPGFIKMHLQQRVYHYVTKLQKRVSMETTVTSRTFDDSDQPMMDLDNSLELVDEDAMKDFEKIEALASLDWRAITGKKHRHLLEAILYEHKSIEEIAELEGVPIKVVRLRLHFACERLKEFNDKKTEYSDFSQRRPDISFEEFLQIKKQMSKIPRTPIILREETNNGKN